VDQQWRQRRAAALLRGRGALEARGVNNMRRKTHTHETLSVI
jgi:hypothetical protein